MPGLLGTCASAGKGKMQPGEYAKKSMLVYTIKLFSRAAQ
jgi:hypothetical protein